MEDFYNRYRDNEYPVKEGLIIDVRGPSAGVTGFIQVANPTYPEPMPPDQCDDTDDYVGNSVYRSLSCPDDVNHNGRYFWGKQGGHIGDLSASHDYEIRWKDGVTDYSWGEWGFEDGSFGKVPFELWDIGFATPHDASDDERLAVRLVASGMYPTVLLKRTTGAISAPTGFISTTRIFPIPMTISTPLLKLLIMEQPTACGD